MSWQNDIQNIKFEIITGDKKIYYPKLVQMYEKNISFNGTQYDFVNRDGSFFDRKPITTLICPSALRLEVEVAMMLESSPLS